MNQKNFLSFHSHFRLCYLDFKFENKNTRRLDIRNAELVLNNLKSYKAGVRMNMIVDLFC